MNKIEQNLRHLWKTIKQTNIYTMRVPEGEDREKEKDWRNNGQNLFKFEERDGSVYP